jgi:transcriptional regulator with XRE-family HTH domain
MTHRRPNYIAEVRRRKNKTQKQVADALGVQLATVNRYENGSRGMDPDTINQMASYLGVLPHELFIKPEDKVCAPNN